MIEWQKYTEVWKHSLYRRHSPGELNADYFLQLAKPKGTIIDFGCGTGRASRKFLENGNNVLMLDFAENCLDEDVRALINGRAKFIQHDLTKPTGLFERYGFCADVMEHIPTEDVPTVLANILLSARNVFFQISCVPDNLGVLIGETLHLTVKPYSWWLEQFNRHHCIIHWSQDMGNAAAFYVSAWAGGKEFHQKAGVNTGDDDIYRNVLANLAAGLPEVRPYERQDKELMILAGGPSLAQFEGEIRSNRGHMGLVTLNGAYNWCIERGIDPSVQVILDARQFNKRFVTPHVEGCRYLLASQCHPETISAAPADRTMLWHSGSSNPVEWALKEYDSANGISREWYPVYGGMTVILRALPLMIMLGFHKFHIYGFDSCLMDGAHHAYAQPENDRENAIEVTVADKTFLCHPWMLTQAYEFQEMIRLMLADTCEMEVYGDGLINHMLLTGAELARSA